VLHNQIALYQHFERVVNGASAYPKRLFHKFVNGVGRKMSVVGVNALHNFVTFGSTPHLL